MRRRIFFLLLYLAFHNQTAAQVKGAQWIVPPVLPDSLEIVDFSPANKDPRVKVQCNGKQGLYDRKGRLLLPVQYEHIAIQEGGWVHAVERRPVPGSGRYERRSALFNDRYEDLGLPYDRFEVVEGGYALVWKGDSCGLINRKGEEVVPVEYTLERKIFPTLIFVKGDLSTEFTLPPRNSGGRIMTIDQEKAAASFSRHKLLWEDGYLGLVDARGDTVVPPIYRLIDPSHPSGWIPASLDRKTWGVIDLKNKTLFPFIAQHHGQWTDGGYLPLLVDDQWGVMRFPGGEEAIPFGQYESIETSDPARDWFEVKKDGKKGIVDASGKVLLPIEYKDLGPATHESVILAQGRLKGFWYPPTNLVVEPQFDMIYHTEDDPQLIVRKDTLWAVLDRATGREIIPWMPFQIEKKSRYYVIDRKYDYTMRATLKGRVHGLLDRKGQVIFEPDSADIYIFPDDSYLVEYHHKASETLNKHFSPDGKLLRSRPKGTIGVRDRFWFVTTTDLETGQYKYAVFSYSDPPGREREYKTLSRLVENVRIAQRDGKFGLVSDEGEVLLPTVFDALEDSKDGYIRAKYQGKWGVLQNPRFDYRENQRQ